MGNEREVGKLCQVVCLFLNGQSAVRLKLRGFAERNKTMRFVYALNEMKGEYMYVNYLVMTSESTYNIQTYLYHDSWHDHLFLC